MSEVDARGMWQLLEPVHAVTYFDPVAREPLQALGIEGFWAGYVVSRAAPLGAVGPAPVTASFFGFHARRLAVLPGAWEQASPAAALQARSDGAVRSLTPHVGDVPLPELADLLSRAAAKADCAGRVLAAANQDLPRPEAPLAAVWQATTTLREHRGDGHVAVLVSRGIGPLAAMQLKVAAGESRAEDLRLGRGWTEEAWAAAAEDLRSHGWVGADGTLTAAGASVRADVERATDAAAQQPWSTLTESELARVGRLLEPVARSVWARGVVPETNPVGVSRP